MPITLVENLEHTIAMLSEFLLNEAQTQNVDCAGWIMLPKPDLEVAKDGTVTLRIAVLEKPVPTPGPIEEALPARRVKRAPVEGEPEQAE